MQTGPTGCYLHMQITLHNINYRLIHNGRALTCANTLRTQRDAPPHLGMSAMYPVFEHPA